MYFIQKILINIQIKQRIYGKNITSQPNIFVVSSSKSHFDGGKFDHLVAYSMTCTIENDDEYELKHGVIRFGSLDEMTKVDGLAWLDVSKGVPKGAGSTSGAQWLVRAKEQLQSSGH